MKFNIDIDGETPTSTAGAFGDRMRNPVFDKIGARSTRQHVFMVLEGPHEALKDAIKEVPKVAHRDGAKPHSFPLNWGVKQLVGEIAGRLSWGGWRWRELGPRRNEEFRRRAGWMTAMAKLIEQKPLLFNSIFGAIAKAPERGIGSPRNNTCPTMRRVLTGAAVTRWKTPGKMIRRLSHGIRRAKEILAPFGITTIPWTVVVNEAANPKGPQRGHKIGWRLALRTLCHITGTAFGVNSRTSDLAKFKGFRLKAWLQANEVEQTYIREEINSGKVFSNIGTPTIVNRGKCETSRFAFAFAANSKIGVGKFAIAEGYCFTICNEGGVYAYKSSGVFERHNDQALIGVVGFTPSTIGRKKVLVITRDEGYPRDQQYDQSIETDHHTELTGQVVERSAAFWRRFAVRLVKK